MKKNCKKCYHYRRDSCCGEETREIMVEDYDVDCFQTEWEALMCELMCPPCEEDEEE